jgi:glycosyltransferase involved in cell wall biosynthesis
VSAGLVVYRALGGIDAIDEHSRRLVGALSAAGVEARYVPDGLGGVRGTRAPWVLLQYNPFRFGRAGFAPRLLAEALALRAPLALMVHEAWIDIRDPRSLLIGGWQRAQLRALLRRAGTVLANTQSLAAELGATHVPVSSNITPLPVSKAIARQRLGLGDGLVVGLFGRANPSRALQHAESAVAALVPQTVLNLGADAPPLHAPGEVRTPGALAPDELSLALRACDLMLLPLTDGVSTKRTTLMAALAHGVPVVGLDGRRTDAMLRSGPLTLTPAGDPQAFARAAVALAGDRDRLRAQGESGRRLYELEFDWPHVARRVAAALG